MSGGKRVGWRHQSNNASPAEVPLYPATRWVRRSTQHRRLLGLLARLGRFFEQRLSYAFVALTLLGLALSATAGIASPYLLEGEAGQLAWLHTPPTGHRAPPVIIIVPDGQQRNIRHERHVEQLRSSGFAVLVPSGEIMALGWLLTAARQSPMIDGDRIGLLSFGTGASLMIEFGRLPLALLYPGCSQLSFPLETAHLLLIHGDADPANPAFACAAMALGWAELGADVTHYVLQGVGYAWDSQPVYALGQSGLRPLAMAHGNEANPNAAVTEQAADMVVQYFRGVLMWDGW